MLNIEKNALLLICIFFPKVLTIFLVNANTHWAYKDCQFNNCFLVKIAALRDCFAFISMLKESINSRQVSVNLLRLVLGRNVNAAMS